mgnify:CR=1 FL=1|jgi:broad specificity phosphatase PhoE
MRNSSHALSRIVLVRHGETDYNSGGRVQGQIDIELNETGRAQAKAMGPVVAQFQPTAVITSDLSRAYETALEITNNLGIEPVVDERIRERDFGWFEGMSRDELIAQHPELYREWRETGEAAGAEIESRSVVGDRFVEAIKDRVAHESGLYVFVSHGSAITQAMTKLLGLSPDGWSGLRGPNNCHWSIVDQAIRAPYWRVVAHNLGLSENIDTGAPHS